MLDALIVGGAVVVLVAAHGLAREAAGRRLRRRQPTWLHTASFGTGAAIAAFALHGPLDTGASLSLHMAQHVLLLAAAAPLLAAGTPLVLFACLLPARRRAALHRLRPRLRRGAGVAAAAALHVTVVLGWHAPPLYEAALASPALHALEHVAFLGTALLVWWAVLAGGVPRRPSVAPVAALLVLALHGAVLGAFLLAARRPLYATYALDAAALRDQQVAGLLMWAGGGVAPVVGAAALVAVWLAGAGRISAPAPDPGAR